MRPTHLSGLDLNLLVVADALLESRSVTTTAATVHLSQPAVSRALGRLRAQLGNDLLVRDGRRMVLTPFAEDLRPRLRAALMTLQRTVLSDETFVPAEATGTVTIASQDFAAFSYLPDAVQRFAVEAPRLEIAVVPYREPFEALLESNEVDVTFGPRPSTKSWIRSEPLFVSPWVCIGARSHRYFRKPSLDAFCTASHVLVSPSGQGPSALDAALGKQRRARHVRLRVPDFAAALAICAQSDLLATVPEALAASACGVLPLRAGPLPVTIDSSRVYLGWHVARTDEPRHAWMRERMTRLAKAEPSRPGGPRRGRR